MRTTHPLCAAAAITHTCSSNRPRPLRSQYTRPQNPTTSPPLVLLSPGLIKRIPLLHRLLDQQPSNVVDTEVYIEAVDRGGDGEEGVEGSVGVVHGDGGAGGVDVVARRGWW
jgi:hypothetical protein